MKKLKIFLFSFFIVLILLNFKIVKIQGNSMEPTIKNNSYAIADRYLHKLFTIQKNDILLFEFENKEVVKKIVGFPGEKITILDKKVDLEKDEIYVLGENLSESIDSRQYGPIKTKNIIGKIFIVF